MNKQQPKKDILDRMSTAPSGDGLTMAHERAAATIADWESGRDKGAPKLSQNDKGALAAYMAGDYISLAQHFRDEIELRYGGEGGGSNGTSQTKRRANNKLRLRVRELEKQNAELLEAVTNPDPKAIAYCVAADARVIVLQGLADHMRKNKTDRVSSRALQAIIGRAHSHTRAAITKMLQFLVEEDEVVMVTERTYGLPEREGGCDG